MKLSDRPDEITILGIPYTVLYQDKPSEVDIYKRESLWGQVDFWTRTIRIYDNGNPNEDVWHTIWHEVLHAITTGLHLDSLTADEAHDDLDLLALALVDVLNRNGWVEDEVNLAREVLAALAHEMWSGWMRHVFEKSTINDDGTVTIPVWAVEGWQRQMNTPYADLSEEEKESDRKEADRVILALRLRSA